ncbi:sensor histidine kinase [Truepera radiovictrix]|uniref:histidine kinase n=1 Tax=Truepera radiovictrix (strain DSM 17093 / CIP 108686 / LMG 22925 / RQ-24) TaxID=649638 RepID=D7CW80_TRURR|nr:HAMP domain-containing sensor histidine kinase [Truepera radiovictrix]ADI16030.1 histidine kinase [Truepera radiovictrix DSM 17093]WMT58343.1 HAMP domain-containing sensor histidine kinase [Truepera radiovictrix]
MTWQGALAAALEVSFDALAALEGGRVVAANGALGALVGCAPHELWGRALGSLVRVEPPAEGGVLEALRRAPQPLEGTLTLWGGKELPVELLWRPWRFQGRPVELVAVRGVSLATSAQSALRRYQATLERKNSDLERANRVQREFLGILSHELRTPLTSVIGYAQVLGDEIIGPLNDKQRAYAETIYTSGLQLMRLIDDLLDLSRLEAGDVALQRRPVAVAELLRAGVAGVGAEARAKGLSVTLQPPPEAALYGDPARLAQVLGALLSNAVKFTPLGGRVWVSAELRESEVVLMVRDDGIGIAPEHHEGVFSPFFLVDASSARQHRGAGLGLALARRIVELHGGRIWVASELGRGSTFYVALPRAPHAPLGATPRALGPS